MSIDIGLMLAQTLPQIVGGADVEMTGHGNRFENVNVVHGRLVRLRVADAVLRRDARLRAAVAALRRGVPFAFWVGRIYRGSQKGGRQPRCSPRGTSGRINVCGFCHSKRAIITLSELRIRSEPLQVSRAPEKECD